MTAPIPLQQPQRRLDLTPLTQPVSDGALAAFVADSKASGKPWRVMTTGLPRPGVGDVVGQLLPVAVPLVGLGFFLVIGRWSLVSAIWRFTFEAPFPFNLVIVAFLALVLAGVVFGLLHVIALLRSLRTPRRWWEAAYRLVGFAAANDLRYGHDEPVDHPGVIFATGADRVAERRLTTTAGRRLEIGNYRYTVHHEDSEPTVFGWGYVAITLDRRLPHLLLDAKANNRSTFGIKTSNLPVDLAPDQRLSLGGEFDERFTLYAPSNYGRDAFEIFTPDLMALFIDRLGTYDVEIVDDTMFLYGNRFDLLAPQTYAWLQELVATVVARTVRRTERYHDDFALLETGPDGQPLATQPVPPPTSAPPALAMAGPADPGRPLFELGGDGGRAATNRVAGQGQRLRRRRWGLGAVVGVLVIAYWLYDGFVAPLFHLPTLGR